MNPVIGILYCGFDGNRQFVTASYIEAVSDAGAVPLIIPYPGKIHAPPSIFKFATDFSSAAAKTLPLSSSVKIL